MRFLKRLKKTFRVREVEDDPDEGVWKRQGIFL